MYKSERTSTNATFITTDAFYNVFHLLEWTRNALRGLVLVAWVQFYKITAYCSQSWPLAVSKHQSKLSFILNHSEKTFNVLFNSFICFTVLANSITNSDETSTSHQSLIQYLENRFNQNVTGKPTVITESFEFIHIHLKEFKLRYSSSELTHKIMSDVRRNLLHVTHMMFSQP